MSEPDNGTRRDSARRGKGRPGYDQATVLRRAIGLFIRKGYEGTSIADLASELGLSKSAIYHHVPSKEHLLALALDEALDELATLVLDAQDEYGGTAYERLRSVVRRSVSILAAHQPAVTLLLRVRGNSEVERAALDRRRRIDAQLAQLARAAAAEGAIRDDLPPELMSRLIFGMVNSLVEWFRPDGEVSAVAVADAITAVVFDGLDKRLSPLERRLLLGEERPYRARVVGGQAEAVLRRALRRQHLRR